MIYKSCGFEETERLGTALAKSLYDRGTKRAFIALYGEVGVGKTVFTRGFCSYFGIKGVKSPTYTVVNEYRGTARVFHFDMYRIEDSDDLLSVGYDDYLMREGYAIAEWCEKIPEDIPNDAITVRISRTEGDTEGRIIEISEDICP